MQVQESGNIQVKPVERLRRTLCCILFYAHFILIAILTAFLLIRGLVSAAAHGFHPENWYPPVMASAAIAGAASFAWQWFAYNSPSKAIRTAFWLGPLLTCAAGVLLLSIDTAASLAAATLALVFAAIQSLYACWVSHRFDHATKVLTVSIASHPDKTTELIAGSIVAGVLYSSFLMSGIGGATSTGTRLDIIFILIILLSLTWTAHLIRNALHITISRIKHTHFTHGVDLDTCAAFQDTIFHSMGRICIGSVLVPILGLIRGSARAISSIAGDTDEFMFSCANCYAGVASRLVMYGNRWGFVQVGVYDKGFMQASADTWDLFKREGMESLIDSDLTGSFCFLSGVAAGALCALSGGSWALVVQKDYAMAISIYTFLIGYLMTRIGMARPQACVSAYHVAFAENQQSLRFDSTIPARIRELQRSQV